MAIPYAAAAAGSTKRKKKAGEGVVIENASHYHFYTVVILRRWLKIYVPSCFGRPRGISMKIRRLALGVIASILFAGPILGADLARAEEPERTIAIENHRFVPAEVEVPAGVRVKLIIENRDDTPEEFESHDLRREKVIPGNSKATVRVGPLPAGEYRFVGEFHEDTAQGKLIAK